MTLVRRTGLTTPLVFGSIRCGACAADNADKHHTPPASSVVYLVALADIAVRDVPAKLCAEHRTIYDEFVDKNRA